MTLSSWDDYPVHQAAEFIAHPATSDRNFYDRYYFNMHPSTGDWFAIFGYGQYPNLGVVDAFIDVRHGRSSTSCAPRRRSSTGATSRSGPSASRCSSRSAACGSWSSPPSTRWPWTSPGRGTSPPWPSPASTCAARARSSSTPSAWPRPDSGRGRSRWAGSISRSPRITAGGPTTAPGASARWVSPRPTASARASSCSAGCGTTSPCSSTTTPSCTSATSATTASGRWCRASGSGSTRTGPWRSWAAEHEHHLIPGTHVIDRSVVRFPEAGIEISCRPLLANFVSIGTGYGIDADWRHGMYHGPEPVTQGLVLAVDEVQGLAQYGIVDHVAEFSYDGHVGYGLLEQASSAPTAATGCSTAAWGHRRTDRRMGPPAPGPGAGRGCENEGCPTPPASSSSDSRPPSTPCCRARTRSCGPRTGPTSRPTGPCRWPRWWAGRRARWPWTSWRRPPWTTCARRSRSAAPASST